MSLATPFLGRAAPKRALTDLLGGEDGEEEERKSFAPATKKRIAILPKGDALATNHVDARDAEYVDARDAEYVDARDAQFDACNLLRCDLQRLETRAEKRNLIRERMSECYLVFVYVFHTSMSLGPLQNADVLDECSDLEVEATTPPLSLFALFDSLQAEQEEVDGDDVEEQRKDAAREVCAWLRAHSDHADWVRAILNRDPFEFHSLFGPLVSFYSLESNLRWYFEQQQKKKEENVVADPNEL